MPRILAAWFGRRGVTVWFWMIISLVGFVVVVVVVFFLVVIIVIIFLKFIVRRFDFAPFMCMSLMLKKFVQVSHNFWSSSLFFAISVVSSIYAMQVIFCFNVEGCAVTSVLF